MRINCGETTSSKIMNWLRECRERWLKRIKQNDEKSSSTFSPPSSSSTSAAIAFPSSTTTNARTDTDKTVEHHDYQHIKQQQQQQLQTTAAAAAAQQLHGTITKSATRISKLKISRRLSTTSSSSHAPSSTQSNSKDLFADDELRLQYTKEHLKVRIICPSARVLTFGLTDVHKRLAELKNEVLLELADDPASLPLFAADVRQLSPRYRLFRSDYQSVELNETLTLAQLNVIDNDTFVLVARRNQMQQLTIKTRETHVPQQEDIEIATRNVTARITDMPLVDINEIFQQSNLQFDVRKVLISLSQASAAIIGAGPYANRVIAMLKQKLINKRNYQNDTLQCLVDMGFKKEKAEYALKLSQGVYSTALEYLIQHQSDEMLPSAEQPQAIGMQKSQSVVSPSAILSNDSIAENVAALLEIVRIYSHRDIPPNQEAVSALVEMGFAETDVLNALKKTCNNKAAACEMLCGNRSDSLIELRDGLADDSPILKSILQLPQVQLNLSNPKIFLAFLSILENENTIRVWGGDNDTTSVITHILQKYHEEKHVLGINQFYSNR